MESIGADIRPPLRLPSSTSSRASSSSSSKEDDRCTQTSASTNHSALTQDQFVSSASTSQVGQSSLAGNVPQLEPPQIAHNRGQICRQNIARAAQIANSGLAAAASEAVCGAEIALEALGSVAEKIGISASTAMIGGAVGWGALGVSTIAIGSCQIKAGMGQGDKEQVAEGVSNILDGISDGMAAVAMPTLGRSGLAGAVGAVAQKAIGPLAVASGVIDAGLGVKEIVEGIKAHKPGQVISGALAAGFGAAVVASALGAGLPALIAAGVMWVAQIGVTSYQSAHQSPSAPSPPSPPSSTSNAEDVSNHPPPNLEVNS